jgi:hypothetical protein
MVESICGQGFAYAHKVEEERLRKLVKLGQELGYKEQQAAAMTESKFIRRALGLTPFYR